MNQDNSAGPHELSEQGCAHLAGVRLRLRCPGKRCSQEGVTTSEMIRFSRWLPPAVSLGLAIVLAASLVYPSPAGVASREDVALGKPLRVTSVGFWRLPAKHITDGDAETSWRANSSDPLPYYAQVDLQGTYLVDRIRLVETQRGGAYRLARYALLLSLDGNSWDLVKEGSTIGAGIEVPVDAHPARYVRLLIIDDAGLDVPQIAQISVFGKEAERRVVTETAALSGASQMRSFRLRELDLAGRMTRSRWPDRKLVEIEDGRYRLVEEFNHAIAFVVPAGTDLSNLTAEFTFRGDRVEVDGRVQRSGGNPHDFSRKVEYSVIAEDGSASTYTVTVHPEPTEARVRVLDRPQGTGMDFVGYSAMSPVEGDNLAHWYAYAGVNGVRYWLTPGRYVGRGNVTDDDRAVDAAGLDALKEDLRGRIRQDPADSTWIDWEGVAARNRQVVQRGGRYTSHYGMDALRGLGIEVMAELNDSQWHRPYESEEEKWQRAWNVWQMFYAQAFYLASHFDVWQFQGPNEPEQHLGRYNASMEARAAASERFVFMNAIYSDAVKAAVEDVNELFDKDLKPIWGAPTLASSPTQDVAIGTIAANRTDYAGRETAHPVTDLFIMQRYSRGPGAFLQSSRSAREMMREHNPGREVLPIAYTEFNYAPGSVWRNRNFTSDAPHVFGAMARVWAENTADGLFGMYQFRISRPIEFGGNHVHHMFSTSQDPALNLLYDAPVQVSSEDPGHPLSHALVNASSSRFAWRTDPAVEGPHEAVWDFGRKREIRRYFVNLGTRDEGTSHGELQYWDDERGEWAAFPGASVRDGSTIHYMAQARVMPGLNSRTPISNTPTVRMSRSFAEPVRTGRVRFVSDDRGPITVRRLHVSEVATEGDIGGPMRSAEVTRLFAEGFQGARPLLATEASALHDPRYTAYIAHDTQRGRYFLWLPQTSEHVDYRSVLDFSDLPGAAGAWVSVREVSTRHFGEVIHRGVLGDDATLRMLQPKDSVWAVVVHPGLAPEPRVLGASDQAQIGLGSAASGVVSFRQA